MFNLNIQDLQTYRYIGLSPAAKAELFDELINDYSSLKDNESINELNSMLDEFNGAMVSFENAMTLYNHAQNHGVSQELITLTGISEEGFLTTVGSAIKNFFKWLWDWCKRIYNFFKEKVFGVKSKGGFDLTPENFKEIKKKVELGVLNVIDIPTNHKEIKSDFYSNIHYRVEHVLTHGTYEELVKKYYQESQEWISSNLFSITWTTTDRDTAKNFIFYIVKDILEAYSEVETFTERLKKLSDIDITKDLNNDDTRQIIEKINSVMDTEIRFDLDQERTDGELIKALRSYWDTVNNTIKLFYKAYVAVKSIGSRMITQLCANTETTAKGGVVVRARPLGKMLDTLREIWKFPNFKLKTVVLTNMTSKTFSKDSGLMGWMTGDSKSDTMTVFVNIQQFSNKDAFTKLVDIDKLEVKEFSSKVTDVYDMPRNYLDAFIETVIHEMRHCLQSQTRDTRMENERQVATHLQYLQQNIEKEARRAGHEYVTSHITDEDREWARAVISRAINQEIANLRKYRVDVKLN